MSEYTISEQMRAWGTAHGWNVDEYADWFSDYLANRTKKYKDNDAAFRNCVRSDWPGFRRQAAFAAKPRQAPWWASDNGIIAEGRRLGLEARPGETMNSYKSRIEAKQ